LRGRAAFIVFEGIDGAGKTTIAKEIVNSLLKSKVDALYTYEPYTADLTKLLRKYGKAFGSVMETLLMAADRYYHIIEVITPALKSGKVVVSDRYYYSSLAYQGAKGVDPLWIEMVNKKFLLKPDVAIYIDVPPDLGLRRKANSPTRLKYLERDLDIIKSVRSIYKELVRRGELIEVDGTLSLDEVIRSVKEILCMEVELLC